MWNGGISSWDDLVLYGLVWLGYLGGKSKECEKLWSSHPVSVWSDKLSPSHPTNHQSFNAQLNVKPSSNWKSILPHTDSATNLQNTEIWKKDQFHLLEVNHPSWEINAHPETFLWPDIYILRPYIAIWHWHLTFFGQMLTFWGQILISSGQILIFSALFSD